MAEKSNRRGDKNLKTRGKRSVEARVVMGGDFLSFRKRNRFPDRGSLSLSKRGKYIY